MVKNSMLMNIKLLTGLGLLTALSSTLVFVSTHPCKACTYEPGCGSCTIYIQNGRIQKEKGVAEDGSCRHCRCR